MRRTSFIIHNKIALTAFTITQHMYSASHRGACTKKNARLPPQCYLTVKTIAPPSATRSPATHVVYHHNKITLTAFTITQHMYSASQSIFATVLQDPHATDTLSIVTWRCRSANERTHTGGGHEGSLKCADASRCADQTRPRSPPDTTAVACGRMKIALA